LAVFGAAQGILKKESRPGMAAKQLMPATPWLRGLIKQPWCIKNVCGFHEKH